jgi:hypothetical protein
MKCSLTQSTFLILYFHLQKLGFELSMKKYLVSFKINSQQKRSWFENVKTCLNSIDVDVETNISNGHSPQIRQNGELLVRMCRGESHFSQKSPLASPGKVGWRMSMNVSSPGKVGWRMSANVSSPTKTGWQMSAQAR